MKIPAHFGRSPAQLTLHHELYQTQTVPLLTSRSFAIIR